jgi:hypothetical protein
MLRNKTVEKPKRGQKQKERKGKNNQRLHEADLRLF